MNEDDTFKALTRTPIETLLWNYADYSRLDTENQSNKEIMFNIAKFLKDNRTDRHKGEMSKFVNYLISHNWNPYDFAIELEKKYK